MPENCPTSSAIAPSAKVAKMPHGLTSPLTAVPSAIDRGWRDHLAHVGLIAERHRLDLHCLRVDCRRVRPEIVDTLQDDVFRRLPKTFMSRLCGVAHHAMFAHDRQRLGVGDSPCICVRERWQRKPLPPPPWCHAMDYGTRMEDPVVSRPSISLCALAASLSGYFWLIGIFTAPEPTTLNRSAAVAIRSSRLAT